MPAPLLQLAEPKQNMEELQAQLEAELSECTEVKSPGRNQVRNFMMTNGIWHIAELDYSARKKFEEYLFDKYSEISRKRYLLDFDRVKQHAIKGQMQLIVNGRYQDPPYENTIFYLPYYPNPKVLERFQRAKKKEELAWHFEICAPEIMKRQIFQVLCVTVKSSQDNRRLSDRLSELRKFYAFCCEESIEDIERIEYEQIQKYRENRKSIWSTYIIDHCRKILPGE